MGMKISEVSKIFDIPAETLRYIERLGLVHPTRSGDGKYREYSMKTFGELIEYMKYRNMGLPVKSILRFTQGGSLSYLEEEIYQCERRLQSEIDASVMLHAYIRDYRAKLEMVNLNMGTYRFERQPEYQHVYVGSANTGKEAYHDTALATQWRKRVPYVSLAYMIKPDQINIADGEVDCLLMCEKRYATLLQLPQDASVRDLSMSLCLCTYIRFGNFDEARNSCMEAMRYAREKGYAPCGPVILILLAWIHEEEGKKRCAQVLIPVKKEETL